MKIKDATNSRSLSYKDKSIVIDMKAKKISYFNSTSSFSMIRLLVTITMSIFIAFSLHKTLTINLHYPTEGNSITIRLLHLQL